MSSAKILWITAALLVSIAIPSGMVRAEEDTEADLYKKVVPSTAFIMNVIPGKGMATGSGSLIDVKNRLVLTNYHVVGTNDWVFIQFPYFDPKTGRMDTSKENYIARAKDGLAYKGTVLFRDKFRDLAVCKLDKAVPTELKAIPFVKDQVSPGTSVWNVGSPGKVSQLFSIAKGNVRVVGVEEFLTGGGGDLKDAFKIKATMITSTNPSNPGDSGGPLVNRKGELVGVCQGGDTTAHLVSFFVDITEVKSLLKEQKLEITQVSAKDSAIKTPNGKDIKVPEKKTDAKTIVKEDPEAKKEKDAASALGLAKLFGKDEENRDTYRSKLQQIVKNFAGTKAATEAKKLLSELP